MALVQLILYLNIVYNRTRDVNGALLGGGVRVRVRVRVWIKVWIKVWIRERRKIKRHYYALLLVGTPVNACALRFDVHWPGNYNNLAM